MKQHIDTAPIWESYRTDCECPICLLSAKVEAQNVDYFLGESVMEPSQRIEVNQKGFCPRHFKQMYDVGNRLGLALMTHTYLKQTLEGIRKNAQEAQNAAAAEAGKNVFQRLGGKKGGALEDSAEAFRKLSHTCVLCERVEESMERYIYTVLYMYKHEAEFPKLFAESKGMCLEHFSEALKMAPKHLSGESLKRFVDTLCEIEVKNMERIEGEIAWFTQKFDYRNQDKPWGNSKDAVKRGINKLRHQIIE